MSDSSPLPPVRLHPEAELARAALSTPLLSRAARLARWAGPETRVDAGGGLVEEQLPAAAGLLGLTGDDAAAYASEAWRVAVDAGLVEIVDEDAGTVRAGEELGLLTGGSPHDVLTVWLAALETVVADASVPDLQELAGALDAGGEVDFSSLDWDPEAEAEFLDGVLGNLYLLTVGEDGPGESPVPLPALAASMIVPDDMGEPTNDVLEQVSDAMMRLDDQFRLLEPIGLVEYQPVDEALMADADEEPAAPVDDTDVTRYGIVRLTPLGVYGLRARLLEAGFEAPAVGELAGKGADALLDGTARFGRSAARAETEQWLDSREPLAAARELLAAARGAGRGRPAAQAALPAGAVAARHRGRTRAAGGAGRPRAGRPRPRVAERAGGRGRTGALPGHGVLADRRHPGRAAPGRGQLRRAAGPGGGAGGSAQRVLRGGLAGGAPRHRGGPGRDGPAAPGQEGGQGSAEGGVQGAVPARRMTVVSHK
ncbi:hypothetical protein GCM10017687_18250 [Streptomyces echinatus]